MKINRFLVLSSLILLIMPIVTTLNVANAQDTRPLTIVKSKWAVHSVIIDGKMSNPKEWSDAAHYDFYIGAVWGTEPPFYKMRLWVKNDQNNVYFLYRVEYPKKQWDLNDGGYVNYFWPQNDPDSGWPYSDGSYVSFTGTYDEYDWNDHYWLEDTANPQGQNNVVGKGTMGGRYYWIEFYKPLNSGDGYDWSFVPGGTYGWRLETPGKMDHMLVGIWDSSTQTAFERYITLTSATRARCHVPK
jgi:hypothetical protein